jgi:hypothetical protein
VPVAFCICLDFSCRLLNRYGYIRQVGYGYWLLVIFVSFRANIRWSAAWEVYSYSCVFVFVAVTDMRKIIIGIDIFVLI